MAAAGRASSCPAPDRSGAGPTRRGEPPAGVSAASGPATRVGTGKPVLVRSSKSNSSLASRRPNLSEEVVRPPAEKFRGNGRSASTPRARRGFGATAANRQKAIELTKNTGEGDAPRT